MKLTELIKQDNNILEKLLSKIKIQNLEIPFILSHDLKLKMQIFTPLLKIERYKLSDFGFGIIHDNRICSESFDLYYLNKPSREEIVSLIQRDCQSIISYHNMLLKCKDTIQTLEECKIELL